MRTDTTGTRRRETVPTDPQVGRLRPSRYYDLALLIVAALGLPALAQLLPALLRVPLGLALVLLAPGYALTAALFAGRDDLDGVARAALSFGSSVAVLPLLALLLDALPWGIRYWPMLLALSAWIVGCCGIAAVRRALLAPEVHVATPSVDLRGWWRAPRGAGEGIVALLAVALIGATLWGAMMIFGSTTAPPQATEFYALGAGGLAEDYPRQVAPGEEMQVLLGIANREDTPMRYRVEIRAGTEVLARLDEITVNAGATWEQPIRYRLARPGDDQAVEFLLFRANADRYAEGSDPYRQLRLWVNVKAEQP